MPVFRRIAQPITMPCKPQSEINIFKAVDISFVKTALAQKQTAGNQKRSAGQRPEKTLAGCQLMRHRQALINMSGNAFRPERDAQMLHGLIRVHQQRASRAEPGGKGKLRQQGRQPSRQNERIVIEEKRKSVRADLAPALHAGAKFRFSSNRIRRKCPLKSP